jgi:hypothetical protein
MQGPQGRFSSDLVRRYKIIDAPDKLAGVSASKKNNERRQIYDSSAWIYAAEALRKYRFLYFHTDLDVRDV